MGRYLRVSSVQAKLIATVDLAGVGARSLLDRDPEGSYGEGIIDAEVHTAISRPDHHDIDLFIVFGLEGRKHGLQGRGGREDEHVVSYTAGDGQGADLGQRGVDLEEGERVRQVHEVVGPSSHGVPLVQLVRRGQPEASQPGGDVIVGTEVALPRQVAGPGDMCDGLWVCVQICRLLGDADAVDDLRVLHPKEAYSSVVPCDGQELTWGAVSKMFREELCPLGTGRGGGVGTTDRRASSTMPGSRGRGQCC